MRSGRAHSARTIIVIAKAPVPGRSKTRLTPPCTPPQAAALAEAALIDTLVSVRRSSARRRVLALDGEVGGLLESLRGFDVIQQRGSGLGERLAAAFEDTGEPALLVGMDTPQMSASLLDRALDLLAESDAVLGDTLDGGYWAIGLGHPLTPAFTGVPMSTPRTALAQRQRLAQLGLSCASLPVLQDVDYYDDAVAVAAQAPESRFSRCFASVSPGVEAGCGLGRTAEQPSGSLSARLVASDGTIVRLEMARWMCEASAAERQMLGRAPGPVLDVGCGPGRHVLALARAGRLALGVDASPSAIDIARRKGAPVLLRSIFERVPAAGRWGSALLLDGNIGIGGNPAALLWRIAGLLRPGGRVFAEVEPPGVSSRAISARLETDRGVTEAFPWAQVGADGVRALAGQAGFRTDKLWNAEGRWFANLELL